MFCKMCFLGKFIGGLKNMKKIVTISFLILLFVSSVYSQDVKPTADKYTVMTSIGATFAIPLGALKESYKYGLGGTFDVALPFSKNYAGRFEMTIHDLMFDTDAFLSTAIGRNAVKFGDDNVTGGNSALMAFKFSFCGGVFKPSEKFGIYGILGAGAYVLSTTDVIAQDNSTSVIDTTINGSVNLYWGLGAGLRALYKINPVTSLFLEGTVEEFFPKENYNAPGKIIPDFYIPIKLGVVFHPF
jgi:hypothetical protein